MKIRIIDASHDGPVEIRIRNSSAQALPDSPKLLADKPGSRVSEVFGSPVIPFRQEKRDE